MTLCIYECIYVLVCMYVCMYVVHVLYEYAPLILALVLVPPPFCYFAPRFQQLCPSDLHFGPCL